MTPKARRSKANVNRRPLPRREMVPFVEEECDSLCSSSSDPDDVEQQRYRRKPVPANDIAIRRIPPSCRSQPTVVASGNRADSRSASVERMTTKDGKDKKGHIEFSFSGERIMHMAKIILFTLWMFLSFVTVLYLHLAETSGGVLRSGPRMGRDGSTVSDMALIADKARGLSQRRPSFFRVPPFPRLRPSSPRTHIPLPLPPNKVSVVLMNYSRPRMIQESILMRTLLTHPNIDEILLLHANPNTAFKFDHPKVVNIDATQQNDQMGLSLRFYFCQLSRNDWVIHVDDDMEFSQSALSELLIEFGRNTRRIVGKFGRNLVSHNSFNGYSSRNTHKQSEVILTKFMAMERDTCSSFFDYSHLIWEDTVLNNGEGPLWNGEDIFMSLVSNHRYGADGQMINYAMDWLDVWNAPESLKDYDNGKLDISGGLEGYRLWDWHWWQSLLRRNRHYSYRGTLWQTARRRLSESGPLERGSHSDRGEVA
uniref:Glycosyl transferase 64 domain-containing protein n=1 Tax=Pseudictyota dubia TaxID=2749911 RepID=A0A7R9VYG3_9STRA|mmetsp:Transcript_26586/g.49356  ORF Transcript_26586/g.49356 Transcript_26586/m.49356 type:complete len:481 (+) Transcript_26586:372-1814(+)